MRGAWALSALLVGLTSMTGSGSASAQPEAGDQARAARLVTLTVATDTDEDVTQIVSYLRPLVEMRGLLLAVRRVDSVDSAHPVHSGSQPGVRARVWLDLRTPNAGEGSLRRGGSGAHGGAGGADGSAHRPGGGRGDRRNHPGGSDGS